MKIPTYSLYIITLILILDGFTGALFPSADCPNTASCGIFISATKVSTGSSSILVPETTDIVREELGYAEQKLHDDPVLSTSSIKFLSDAHLNILDISSNAASRIKEANVEPKDDKAIRQAVITEIATSYSKWLQKRVDTLTTNLLEIGSKIFPKEPDVFQVLTFIDSMKNRYSAGNDLFTIENVIPGDVKTQEKYDSLPVSFSIDTSYGTLLKFLEDMDSVGDLTLQKTLDKVTPLFDIVSIKILPKEETVRTDDIKADVSAIFYFQKVDSAEVSKAKSEYEKTESEVMEKLGQSPEKKTAEVEGLLTRIDKEKEDVVQLDQKNTRELVKRYQNLQALWEEVKSKI